MTFATKQHPHILWKSDATRKLYCIHGTLLQLLSLSLDIMMNDESGTM